MENCRKKSKKLVVFLIFFFFFVAEAQKRGKIVDKQNTKSFQQINQL